MTNFIKIVKDVLNEQNTVGSGGVLGTFAEPLPGGSLDYSANDHRLPYSLPHIHRRSLNRGESIVGAGNKKRYGSRGTKRRKTQK